MFDDLAAYFFENPVALHNNYLKERDQPVAGRNRDVKAAVVAASAIYHFAEHLPKGLRLDEKSIIKACPEYAVLRDVTNLAKHKKLSAKYPVVRDLDDIQELIVVTEYEDASGPYKDIEKVVAVTLTDGTQEALGKLNAAVLEFWAAHLHSQGVIDRAYKFSGAPRAGPLRREECNSASPTLEIVKGLRFRLAFQLRKFNYASGKAELTELTGHQARLRLRAPRTEIELSLTHESSGIVLTRTVGLSEEESATLGQFATDEQKQGYVATLESVRTAWEQLVAEAAQRNQEPDPSSGGPT